MNDPELVIVMPAYNEAGCIEIVVNKWLDVFEKLNVSSGRLVVVNDGSKDNTGALLDAIAQKDSRLTVVHQANAGHGPALLHAYRKGLEFSPKYVFHVDSDDQFMPEDLAKLWQRREESKFIVGFRQVRHDAFHRLVITKILVALNLILFGVFLKDSNVPFRLIRADYLRKLLSALPPNIFAPNVFLSVLAASDKQNLMYIPISHQDRKTGKVSIVKWGLIKACMRSAGELFNFRQSLKQKLTLLKD